MNIMQLKFEGYIPSIHEGVIRIFISDPIPNNCDPDYHCLILVDPIDNSPHKLFGVDAEHVAYLARHFLVTRFIDSEIQDLNHKRIGCDLLYRL